MLYCEVLRTHNKLLQIGIKKLEHQIQMIAKHFGNWRKHIQQSDHLTMAAPVK